MLGGVNAIIVGNHLVQLYREAQRPIKTVMSTHHALFFNVLHYELQNHMGKPLQYILKRDRRTDGYLLAEQAGDMPQFYHVAALAELWLVAQSGQAKTWQTKGSETNKEGQAKSCSNEGQAQAKDGEGSNSFIFFEFPRKVKTARRAPLRSQSSGSPKCPHKSR